MIRPSEFVGARRKTVLRGAGYAWTLDLRNFDKLREVGDSPYLGFYALFKSYVDVSVGRGLLNDRLIRSK